MSLSVRLDHRQGDFALGVDFVATGGVTALFGRSGAGKSTVIRAIAGLVRPDDGMIRIAGRTVFDGTAGTDVPPHRRRVAVVFQAARLMPHLSVRRNLSFARWVGRRPRDGEAERVTGMLGLEPLLDRRPAALSGGERQRVAIGQALLSDPHLLLLDEPLSGLDEARAAEIMPYLERLRDEVGLPMVYVSHRVSEVARLADRVVVLDAGRQVADGPVREVFAARGALSGREAGAVLDGTIVSHDPRDALTEVALDGTAFRLTLPTIGAGIGARVRLRVRAGDVMLALDPPGGLTSRNVLPGRVVSIETGEGPGALVGLVVEGEGARLVARVTQRAVRDLALEKGRPVHAILKSFAAAPEDVTVLAHRADG